MRCQRVPAMLALAALLVACADASDTSSSATTTATASGALTVAVQNSEVLVGVDRISVALFDASRRPVIGATVTVDLTDTASGRTFETRPLESIGSEYAHSVGAEFGRIPVYIGVARFPAVGVVTMTVHATLTSGAVVSGAQNVDVTTMSQELSVSSKVPALRQPIVGDPGVTIAQIDSGVPPDDWHSATIADGLARRMPMVLYFGEPGFCKSQTCGPTVAVLQKLCATYCGRLLFEHIEDHFPAGPDETAKDNPAFDAFGLQTDPWI